jgi:hypothetical protein
MLFKRNPRKSEEELEGQIRDLLMRAELDRIPGADAAAYNAAGDLCHEAGFVSRALSYYGLSIDAFLKVERWDSAAAICRKILRISPIAVRARCTLAWLAIGKGLSAEADRQLRDYVHAAVDAHNESLAVAQLKRMGDVAPNPTIKQSIAELLLELGADKAADFIFGAAFRERNTGRKSPVSEEMLWSTVRRAALLGPRELVAAR